MKAIKRAADPIVPESQFLSRPAGQEEARAVRASGYVCASGPSSASASSGDLQGEFDARARDRSWGEALRVRSKSP